MKALLTLALFLLILPAVAAQNCGELGKEVRGVQSTAFDEYPSLNDVKQGILLMLYGRGSDDCPQGLYDYASTGKGFIVKFDEAHNLSKSNSSSDRIRALNLSADLKEVANSKLGETSLGVSAQDVAASADTAIGDFLVTQGNYNEREGEVSNRTRDKIEYYRQATIAYESAGESILATNTRIIWERLESRYLRDMQEADGLYSRGEEEFKQAQSLSRDIPSRITAYIKSKEAQVSFQEALLLYTYHEETEKIAMTEDYINNITALIASLKVTLGVYFLVLAVFFMAVSLFLLNRILAWEADSYEQYLGNELIRVKGVER